MDITVLSLIAIPTAALFLILLLDFRRNRECITTYCPVHSLKCVIRLGSCAPKCLSARRGITTTTADS